MSGKAWFPRSRSRLARPLLAAALSLGVSAPAAAAGFIFYGDAAGGYWGGPLREWHALQAAFVESHSRLGFGTQLIGGHHNKGWGMTGTQTTKFIGSPPQTTPADSSGVFLLSILPLHAHFTPYVWKVKGRALGAVDLYGSFSRWSIPLGYSGPPRIRQGAYDEFGIRVSLPLIGFRLGRYHAKVRPFSVNVSDFGPFPINSRHYDHGGFSDQGLFAALEVYLGAFFAGDPEKTETGFLPWLR